MFGGSAFGSAPFGAGGDSGALTSLTAPSPELVATGNSHWALLVGPPPTLVAAGGPAPWGAILSTPSPVLAAYGGANATLGAPSGLLAITATVMNWGSAAVRPPAAKVSASGTVSAVAGASLAPPMASLVGYSGAVVSITLVGSPTVLATGNSGTIGVAAVTAPLFDLVASGTVNGLSYADLLAPSPRLGATAQAWLVAPSAQLTAIGTAVVTATYEAYALNLNHTTRYSAGQPIKPTDEATHYTNFPFTHVVRYKNSYYGANSTGLYLLEGTTDDGADINWNVQTAFSDFGSPNLKTLNSAYFGGRFGPVTNVTLLVSEADTEAYVYTTPLDDTAKNYRQAFGRGNKARYYAVAADGAGEVTIDSITFNIATLARRI